MNIQTMPVTPNPCWKMRQPSIGTMNVASTTSVARADTIGKIISSLSERNTAALAFTSSQLRENFSNIAIPLRMPMELTPMDRERILGPRGGEGKWGAGGNRTADPFGPVVHASPTPSFPRRREPSDVCSWSENRPQFEAEPTTLGSRLRGNDGTRA